MLKELLSFIRFRIAVGLALLAFYGCLIYECSGEHTITVTVAAFFVTASVYALNNITDVKEDVINRKRINHFSTRTSGYLITAALGLLGLVIAATVSSASFFAFMIITAGLAAYSLLRVKQVTLLKNVYTAFFITLIFLSGSFESFPPVKILEAVFMFAYTLIGTVIADIRDIKGDRESKVFTLPVVIGKDASVASVAILSAALAAYAVLFNLVYFYVALPFLALMLVFLQQNRYELSHVTGTFALMAMIGFALYAQMLV